MTKKFDFSLSESDCIQIEFAFGLYISECEEFLSYGNKEHILAAQENAKKLRECFKNYRIFESHE